MSSDYNLAPIKHEGGTVCDCCWRSVGELHRVWCAYWSPIDPDANRDVEGANIVRDDRNRAA